MIVITGAAGFIGSVLLGYFNHHNKTNILSIDDIKLTDKWKNIANKKMADFIGKEQFISNIDKYDNIEMIVHLGACADTTEKDGNYLMANNFEFSKKVFKYCADRDIPLIYASSAATYGDGCFGYSDTGSIDNLIPLNMYGFSKQIFDKWVMCQDKFPSHWAGFKFFNVYGPNEYHKGRMASVIFHAFNQLKEHDRIKLFRSHRDGFFDGEQRRDFVYVKDVVSVLYNFYSNFPTNGIYNLGTGVARSFNDLASNVIKSCNSKGKIEYIDMPEDIRDKYQYHTEADINKLNSIGIIDKFHSLEDGIYDYVCGYLLKEYRIY